MKRLFIKLLAIIAVAVYPLAGFSAEKLSPEARLIEAVSDIQASNLQTAELKLNELVLDVPDFKLAQLVLADVLMSKVQGVSSTAAGLQDGLEKNSMLSEIRNRYKASSERQLSESIPSVLARIDSHYSHAIVVDLSKSRLYLFDNSQQQPRLIKNYFISMGRGGAVKFD